MTTGPTPDPSPTTTPYAELGVRDIVERQRYSAGPSASDIVAALLRRIGEVDRGGPALHALAEGNSDAAGIAARLDDSRIAGRVGALHAVPMAVKDNLDTADGMATAAGSTLLTGGSPVHDATAVQRVRDAGAIIFGKTNMTVFDGARSRYSVSGWSPRGGLTLNPHALDRSPGGGSSGSAAAVAAGLVAAALATDTDGSLLCPASFCGVVGVRPTWGLVSRAGMVPVAPSFDTVGVIARSVADAAAVLTVIAGPDPRDPTTATAPTGIDYTAGCDGTGLVGARIGVAGSSFFGRSLGADVLADQAIGLMSAAGATIVEDADIPTAGDIADSEDQALVLLFELRASLDAYLASRPPGAPRSLAELVAAGADAGRVELPLFGQDIFEEALSIGGIDDPAYRGALGRARRRSRDEGIDAVMAAQSLDVLVMPTYQPAYKTDLVNGDGSMAGASHPAAMAGYPAVTVPIGLVAGLPVGLTFVSRAFTEPALLRLAHAFEQLASAYQVPAFRRPGIG
ncbi:MAG: N-carbamoylputrescine amidase [Frankiales bacterium]|nr:N-carbamoylputrescine amidase [Frankiales bacterium]